MKYLSITRLLFSLLFSFLILGFTLTYYLSIDENEERTIFKIAGNYPTYLGIKKDFWLTNLNNEKNNILLKSVNKQMGKSSKNSCFPILNRKNLEILKIKKLGNPLFVPMIQDYMGKSQKIIKKKLSENLSNEGNNNRRKNIILVKTLVDTEKDRKKTLERTVLSVNHSNIHEEIKSKKNPKKSQETSEKNLDGNINNKDIFNGLITFSIVTVILIIFYVKKRNKLLTNMLIATPEAKKQNINQQQDIIQNQSIVAKQNETQNKMEANPFLLTETKQKDKLQITIVEAKNSNIMNNSGFFDQEDMKYMEKYNFEPAENIIKKIPEINEEKINNQEIIITDKITANMNYAKPIQMIIPIDEDSAEYNATSKNSITSTGMITKRSREIPMINDNQSSTRSNTVGLTKASQINRTPSHNTKIPLIFPHNINAIKEPTIISDQNYEKIIFEKNNPSLLNSDNKKVHNLTGLIQTASTQYSSKLSNEQDTPVIEEESKDDGTYINYQRKKDPTNIIHMINKKDQPQRSWQNNTRNSNKIVNIEIIDDEEDQKTNSMEKSLQKQNSSSKIQEDLESSQDSVSLYKVEKREKPLFRRIINQQHHLPEYDRGSNNISLTSGEYIPSFGDNFSLYNIGSQQDHLLYDKKTLANRSLVPALKFSNNAQKNTLAYGGISKQNSQHSLSSISDVQSQNSQSINLSNIKLTNDNFKKKTPWSNNFQKIKSANKNKITESNKNQSSLKNFYRNHEENSNSLTSLSILEDDKKKTYTPAPEKQKIRINYAMEKTSPMGYRPISSSYKDVGPIKTLKFPYDVTPKKSHTRESSRHLENKHNQLVNLDYIPSNSEKLKNAQLYASMPTNNNIFYPEADVISEDLTNNMDLQKRRQTYKDLRMRKIII